MAKERNARELRNILRAHSVKGYPVDVPLFGAATVIKQPMVGGWISYVVEPDDLISFARLADWLRLSYTQMDLAQWKEKYARAGRTLSAMLPIEIMDRLEKGGYASEVDRQFVFLKDQGCIDAQGRVVCYAFPYKETTIPIKKLRKGMLVMFSDYSPEGYGTTKGWPGRVVGFQDQRKTVLLELFYPTPAMRVPEGTLWGRVRPGFYSSLVGVLGKGLAGELEDQGLLPPGKWSQDGVEYVLEEPLSIEEIQRFCDKEFFSPGNWFCLNQAMLMYVIPIPVTLGEFHPLPEAIIDLEAVITPDVEDVEIQEPEEGNER